MFYTMIIHIHIIDYMIYLFIVQINIRDQQGMNESIWREKLNTKLQKEFNFNINLSAVFIDTFHNREKQDEVDKFSENTRVLWTFAQNKLGINQPINTTILS